MIVAEEQSGGIGRLGRHWVSPPGGIWTTIILKPEIPIDHVFMVTMAGSIALVRTIRKLYGIGALIKWPNDIYIGDRKVAGILLEISAEAEDVKHCILGGIGIDANVPPSPFQETWGGLPSHRSRPNMANPLTGPRSLHTCCVSLNGGYG